VGNLVVVRDHNTIKTVESLTECLLVGQQYDADAAVHSKLVESAAKKEAHVQTTHHRVAQCPFFY
jgi:hypothetical protein